jgi:hypothetical protein
LQPSVEKQAVDWIKWLVREEAYFESESGCAARQKGAFLNINIFFWGGGGRKLSLAFFGYHKTRKIKKYRYWYFFFTCQGFFSHKYLYPTHKKLFLL